MPRIAWRMVYIWKNRIPYLCLCLYLCLRLHPPFTAAYTKLSQEQVLHLVSIRDPAFSIDSNNSSSHLSRIMIPRPSGTVNNTIVKDYIVSRFTALDWDVEEDSLIGITPYGEKRFTNIIATKNPHAPRRIILSAHFDSKFFATEPLNQFVGATDSAASCAILLDVAETLNDLLNQRQGRLNKVWNIDDDFDEDDEESTTLQMVFFDGEEALQDWTETDSLYGSRHLAEKWDFEYVSPSPQTRRRLSAGQTKLSTIEHLILLDLLGSEKPRVSSYFLTTGWLFDNLISVEKRLHTMGVFSPQSDAREMESFFIHRVGNQMNSGGIADDHLPFLKRGVSVLHVIPNPFPSVWHKLSDDASALDLLTLKKWSLLFRVFTAEYLHLRPNVPNKRDLADLVCFVQL